jgi:hypothetical protein
MNPRLSESGSFSIDNDAVGLFRRHSDKAQPWIKEKSIVPYHNFESRRFGIHPDLATPIAMLSEGGIGFDAVEEEPEEFMSYQGLHAKCLAGDVDHILTCPLYFH